MATKDEEQKIVVLCGKCNVSVEAAVKKTYSVKEIVKEEWYAPEDGQYEIIDYRTALCVRCESVFFIKDTWFYVEGVSAPQGHEVLYPPPGPNKAMPEDIPSKVKRIYLSAYKCFQVGEYEPSLIMGRKCIEAVCKELGAEKSNLKENLERLKRDKKIDSQLLEWAEGLRLIGNDAAHDLDTNFTKKDARDGLDFVEAILSYIFTLRKKFEKFQKRQKPGKKQSANSPSA